MQNLMRACCFLLLFCGWFCGCSRTYTIAKAHDAAYHRFDLFGSVSTGTLFLANGDSLPGKRFVMDKDSLRFTRVESREIQRVALANIRAVTIRNRRSGRAGGFLIGSAAGLALGSMYAMATIDKHADMAGLGYAVTGGLGWLAGGLTGLLIGGQGDLEKYVFRWPTEQDINQAGKSDGQK
ncbi:MAG: hypothetical protein BWY83_03386 [bacterium ADurb.Bin478]|nr:MAG: hypothetical protein BWY83_03386 [bacterium ADurb.Bin478]